MTFELEEIAKNVLDEYPTLKELKQEEKFMAMPSAKFIDTGIKNVEEFIRGINVSDFEKKAMNTQLEFTPGYEKAFIKDNNITAAFEDYEQSRIATKANMIMEFYGVSRKSKSYSNIYNICKNLDNNFEPEQIFFSTEKLNTEAHKFSPKPGEMGKTVSNDDKIEERGVGSRSIEVDFKRMIQTVGKLKLSITNCSTTPRLGSCSHIQLESVFLDRSRFKSRFLIHYPIITMSGRLWVPVGWVEFGHPIKFWSKEKIMTYEANKDKFINDVGLGQVDEDRLDLKADEVFNSKIFIKFNGYYGAIGKKMPSKTLRGIVERVFPKMEASNYTRAIASRVEFLIEEAKIDDEIKAVKND